MRIGSSIVGVLFLLALAKANGQQTQFAALPDSPTPQSVTAQSPATAQGSAAPQSPSPGAPPEAIPGDSLFAAIAIGPGPESLKTKAESYVVVTFGPRAMVAPAFSAAFKMARPPKGYPREWVDGGPAFGRNYGAALGNRVASETARYGFGALLHEDFRYRPSKQKGMARLFYAIGYTFVDSSDSGHRTLAVANFASAAAGGFVGNLYLPDGYNSPGDGAVHFATRLAGLAGTNISREFAPEIFKATHSLHIPFPRIPVPEWWTKGLSVSRP